MNFIDEQWHWTPGNLDTCKMPGLRISTTQGYVEVKQYNADMLDALADIAHEQEQAMRESEQSEWSLVDRTDGIINVDLINDHISNDHQREH